MSNPLRDMDKPDVIFCIGTNMTECHPVAATRIKRAVARGAKLIVADPRRIPLAEMADIYLPLRVGSDVALLLGMAHVIAREGLMDEVSSRRTTEGRFPRAVMECRMGGVDLPGGREAESADGRASMRRRARASLHASGSRAHCGVTT